MQGFPLPHGIRHHSYFPSQIPQAGQAAPPAQIRASMSDPNLSSFIWSVADLLRGDYKQSEYGKVILPFTVLRRLDCVLEPTKAAVLAEKDKREAGRAESRALPAAQVRPALLQHLAARPEEAHGRPGPHRRKPARLHAGVLARRARHLRELRVPHPDRPPRQVRPALPRHREVRQHRPPPRCRQQCPDGRRVRGTDPQVRRTVQRDRRGALHPARGHPADGQSALHRGRRSADQARRGALHLRPHRRHRRHVERGRASTWPA